MILGIIGTLMVGVAAACLLFVASRLAKGMIPKWIIPAGSAVAMFVFFIWSEYSWYSRAAANFPDSVTVTQTYGFSFILQPWTYVIPKINRFSAVDRASIKPNKKLPGYYLAELILVTRYEPSVVVQLIVDCEGRRRAFLNPATEFADNGLPKQVKWGELEVDDPLFGAVCR